MINTSSIVTYFSFIGAIVAFFLGILKLIEYLKDKPLLSIKYTNIFYDYSGKETKFHINLEMINKGRRPITVINILVDILTGDNKQINIHSRLFEIKTKLLPQDHSSKGFVFGLDKKLPKKDYKLRLQIITSHKKYKKIISVPYFDDYTKPIYDEISDGIKKGLIE